jgi:transcription antitermination factor NusG
MGCDTSPPDECASCSEGCARPPHIPRFDLQDVSTWPGTWIVGETNPQKMGHAVDLIEDYDGCAVYVPRVQQTRMQGGKRRVVTVPLFEGYLFINLPTPETRPYWQSDWGLFELITINDQRRFVKELSQIQKVIQVDPNATFLSKLTPGKQVQVRYGPFQGAIGFIIIVNQRHRLVLVLSELHMATTVEIDPAAVDLVNGN